MAKKQAPAVDADTTQVVEEFHVANEDVEYTDVTGKDDLPEGVSEVVEEEEKPEPKAKKAAPKAAPKKDEDDEIPADLKEKTPAQLAKMYKEAQALIGRQGTELGDLRKTADTYIKAHLKAQTPKPEPKAETKKPDAVDFFTNPEEAIARAVAEHPLVKELQGAKKETEAREVRRHMETASTKFNTAHPDASEIMVDENFQNWVVKSPVRKELLLRAHQRYDFAAADDLFSTWKELKAVKAPVKEEPKPAGKPVAGKEAARVPTGGNASPKAPQASGQGKIYRRADVIKLMQTDPERYALMGEEITKAYQEGRVR